MLNVKYTHNGNGSHKCNIEMMKQVIELKLPLPLVHKVIKVIALIRKNKQTKSVFLVFIFSTWIRDKIEIKKLVYFHFFKKIIQKYEFLLLSK